jgi:general secretion pathway protein C
METLLRRRFWIVNSVATAVVAVCIAHAAASAIAGATWGHGHAIDRPRPHPPRVETAQARPLKSIEPILQRNIFCSTCTSLIASPPLAVDAPALNTPRATTLPLRLLAIMYAPPPIAARWSVAIIRDVETSVSYPRVEGAAVREARIDQIDQTRVYLDFGGGRREFLDLLEPTTPLLVSRRASPPIAPPSRDGIRRTGEHQYDVQRSTLQAWLDDLPRLAFEVRVVPEIRDGRAAGLRLLGMRADGPLTAIGLRNGDVVVGINGLEIDSPDKGIAAYIKLRSSSHVSLAIERAGHRINQELSVR